jgi:hypothetical protein
MKVKELKELLKDQPDDLEVILGSIDFYYYDKNRYFKFENIDRVELFHREIHTGQYLGVEYYMDTDRCVLGAQTTDSKKEVLLLYNKSCILLKDLQPNILISEFY